MHTLTHKLINCTVGWPQRHVHKYVYAILYASSLSPTQEWTHTHTLTSNWVVFLRGVYVKEAGSWNSLHTSHLWRLETARLLIWLHEEASRKNLWHSHMEAIILSQHHFLSLFIFTFSPPILWLSLFHSRNFSSHFFLLSFSHVVCVYECFSWTSCMHVYLPPAVNCFV